MDVAAAALTPSSDTFIIAACLTCLNKQWCLQNCLQCNLTPHHNKNDKTYFTNASGLFGSIKLKSASNWLNGKVTPISCKRFLKFFLNSIWNSGMTTPTFSVGFSMAFLGIHGPKNCTSFKLADRQGRSAGQCGLWIPGLSNNIVYITPFPIWNARHITFLE